jgi:hypothetical protein
LESRGLQQEARKRIEQTPNQGHQRRIDVPQHLCASQFCAAKVAVFGVPQLSTRGYGRQRAKHRSRRRFAIVAREDPLPCRASARTYRGREPIASPLP